MKIRVHHWENECGDGCCYTWGVDLYINGVKYEEQTFPSFGEALEFVLTQMGHEVDETHEGYED